MYKFLSDCQIPDLANILELVIGFKTDGTFVEVGANDGKSYSNTYPLAELGWSGLCIEPVRKLYLDCIYSHRDHEKVRFLNKFISNDEVGMEMMFIRHDMNTADEDFARLIDPTMSSFSSIMVETMTLDDALIDADIHPMFDLLVIDVEGHELQVLEGFTIGAYSPRMVIIETHEKNKNPVLRKNSDAISQYFETNGYAKIYADAINTIFIAEGFNGHERCCNRCVCSGVSSELA